MKLFCLALLVMFSSQFATAHAAEPVDSADAFLTGLLQTSGAQCTQNKGTQVSEYKAKGDLLGAYQVEQAEKMICECVPGRAKALQARLSKSERAKKMSESAFSKKYMSGITNHCVGEQLQSTFAGACAERYAKRVPDSAKFCSCMTKFTSGLSGAQAAQLGGEASDYLPRAAEAGKRGEATPAPPPLLKSMMETQKACAQP